MGFEAVAYGLTFLVSAGSAAYTISENNKQADAAQSAADSEAKQVIEQGQSEADNIRRRALILQKSQEAQLAGSGVEIGSGTAGALTTETNKLAEEDILATLKESRRRAEALKAGGSLAKSTANSRNIGSGLSFFGSAVNTGYNRSQGGGSKSTGGNISSSSSFMSNGTPNEGNMSPWGMD